MKLQPNPKVFIALTALTLVAGIGLTYVEYSSGSETSMRIQQLKKNSKDERQLKTDLDTTTAQLQDCSLKLQHLEQGVPELAYIPTMLKELEKVGKDNGIEVTGVRPIPVAASTTKGKDGKPIVEKKAYTELNIEVKGRGYYSSVLKFVNALQTFPKIVAARTVSLSPKSASNDPGEPKLEITIQLRSYLFSDKDAPAVPPVTGTQPAPGTTTPGAPLAPGTKSSPGPAKPSGTKKADPMIKVSIANQEVKHHEG